MEELSCDRKVYAKCFDSELYYCGKIAGRTSMETVYIMFENGNIDPMVNVSQVITNLEQCSVDKSLIVFKEEETAQVNDVDEEITCPSKMTIKELPAKFPKLNCLRRIDSIHSMGSSLHASVCSTADRVRDEHYNVPESNEAETPQPVDSNENEETPLSYWLNRYKSQDREHLYMADSMGMKVQVGDRVLVEFRRDDSREYGYVIRIRSSMNKCTVFLDNGDRKRGVLSRDLRKIEFEEVSSYFGDVSPWNMDTDWDIGFRVKLRHPISKLDELAIVVDRNSQTYTVQFEDGLMDFNVDPNEAIADTEFNIELTKQKQIMIKNNRPPKPKAFVGNDFVLAFSNRFKRYCSGQVISRTGPTTYSIAFDYGDMYTEVEYEYIVFLCDSSVLLQQPLIHHINSIENRTNKYFHGEKVKVKQKNSKYIDGIIKVQIDFGNYMVFIKVLNEIQLCQIENIFSIEVDQQTFIIESIDKTLNSQRQILADTVENSAEAKSRLIPKVRRYSLARLWGKITRIRKDSIANHSA